MVRLRGVGVRVERERERGKAIMCNMHAEDYGRLYFSTLHSWDINCIFFFQIP